MAAARFAMHRRMVNRVAWALAPLLVLLAVAVWVGDSELDDVPFLEQVVNLEDPKASRTAALLLEPLARPGTAIPVSITLDPEVWDRFEHDSFNKASTHDTLEPAQLAIGSNPPLDVGVRVRGRSSTRTRRKSLYVDFGHLIPVDDTIRTRKLLLINLYDDPFGFEHELCYRLLSERGLFYSRRQFAAVTVNNKALGLYLIVERPEDAARRQIAGLYGIYRTRHVWPEHERVWLRRGFDPRPLFAQLEGALDLRDPAEQEQALAQVMDLEGYMTWLVFNSLVQNADSVDELFFLLSAQPDGRRKVQFSAWDYDNLQEPEAHPGDTRYHPLLFGAELPMDDVIMDNPRLFQRFKRQMRDLLSDPWTDEKLIAAIDALQVELDGLDDGLDAETQAALRHDRDVGMRRFKAKLLRRRKLLDVLSDPMKAR